MAGKEKREKRGDSFLTLEKEFDLSMEQNSQNLERKFNQKIKEWYTNELVSAEYESQHLDLTIHKPRPWSQRLTVRGKDKV